MAGPDIAREDSKALVVASVCKQEIDALLTVVKTKPYDQSKVGIAQEALRSCKNMVLPKLFPESPEALLLHGFESHHSLDYLPRKKTGMDIPGLQDAIDSFLKSQKAKP